MNWIKFRTNLATDGRVVRIAGALKIPQLHVVGCLAALWFVADEHTTDGILEGYSAQSIDDLVRVPGFAKELQAVKWLRLTDTSAVIPRFHEHNGASAKRRAQTAERVSRSRNARSVTKCAPTTEQSRTAKSREDIAADLKQSSLTDLCSMLSAITFRKVRLFDASACASIAQNRNVSAMQIAWVTERMNERVKKGELENPSGYFRSMLENQKPPAGWVEKYRRRELAAMAAKAEKGGA